MKSSMSSSVNRKSMSSSGQPVVTLILVAVRRTRAWALPLLARVRSRFVHPYIYLSVCPFRLQQQHLTSFRSPCFLLRVRYTEISLFLFDTVAAPPSPCCSFSPCFLWSLLQSFACAELTSIYSEQFAKKLCSRHPYPARRERCFLPPNWRFGSRVSFVLGFSNLRR
jgi:hypothetical protein